MTIIRNHQNSIGNYLGPYIAASMFRSGARRQQDLHPTSSSQKMQQISAWKTQWDYTTPRRGKWVGIQGQVSVVVLLLDLGPSNQGSGSNVAASRNRTLWAWGLDILTQAEPSTHDREPAKKTLKPAKKTLKSDNETDTLGTALTL